MSPDPGPERHGPAVVASPLQGTVVKVGVTPGQEVAAGGMLLIIESMKMEHVVSAVRGGTVASVSVAVGDLVADGQTVVVIEPGGSESRSSEVRANVDPDTIRPDLAEVLARQALTRDPARPEMVERRHREHRRSARENIDDLCDPGSFTEYGSLAIAAQRNRRELQELIERTPADGLVAGIGRVNGDRFGDRAACAALSYDYTVLAGTQGQQNHRKKDRMFELIERLRLPVVLFAEGGGGRPGDTDNSVITGLDCLAFALFGGLSGLVPLVGIASGRCFAGNAALLGCCDVIIATRESSIGMGGPAMIEGGGLGVVTPDEIGPIEVQTANGVVDLVADDDADAVRLAKQYLSYFQGALPEWSCADQRLLRSAIPENRLRVYPIRDVIDTVADTGSVLELRPGFGEGMVTALDPDGRPADGGGGQQPGASRGGHRPRRGRQGGPLPAAVRRP